MHVWNVFVSTMLPISKFCYLGAWSLFFKSLLIVFFFLCLQVTGDQGKAAAVQRNFRKFGIEEITRIERFQSTIECLNFLYFIIIGIRCSFPKGFVEWQILLTSLLLFNLISEVTYALFANEFDEMYQPLVRSRLT
jgi:hypothetical protein